MTDDFKYWNIHRDNNIQLLVMDLQTKNLFKPVMNMTEQHHCISQDREDLGFQEGGGGG